MEGLFWLVALLLVAGALTGPGGAVILGVFAVVVAVSLIGLAALLGWLRGR